MPRRWLPWLFRSELPAGTRTRLDAWRTLARVAETLLQLLEWLRRAPLVAFNVGFCRTLLQRELARRLGIGLRQGRLAIAPRARQREFAGHAGLRELEKLRRRIQWAR